MDWPDTRVRTPMEAGAAKLRRRFTAAPEPTDVELILTGNQAAILREFVNDTLEAGTLPFEWFDFRPGVAPGVEAEYRFVTIPKVRPRAPRQDGEELWVATFQLELMPAVSAPTAPATGGPGGSRSNFAGGFGTMDGGGLEPSGSPDLGGAFNHEWVPGSIDQGQPGGANPLGGAGIDPGCSGTVSESTSSSCA